MESCWAPEAISWSSLPSLLSFFFLFCDVFLFFYFVRWFGGDRDAFFGCSSSLVSEQETEHRACGLKGRGRVEVAAAAEAGGQLRGHVAYAKTLLGLRLRHVENEAGLPTDHFCHGEMLVPRVHGGFRRLRGNRRVPRYLRHAGPVAKQSGGPY